MTRTFTFGEQLAMSDGHAENIEVKALLLEYIPGALAVHRAHKENDKHGTDWWVEHSTGRHISVDVKVRKEDWAAKPIRVRKDDLALETWSVIESRIVGWTRDPTKRTDYVLWLWMDTKRFCLLPFPMLCRVMQQHWECWKRQYQTAKQFTKERNSEWHSECIFVPRNVVWDSIKADYLPEPCDLQQCDF